jgi:hypothetical protein
MAGYSGTPLAKKLGIVAGSALLVCDAPPNYRELLEPWPADVAMLVNISAKVDVIHMFVTSRLVLESRLKKYRTAMRENATVWVSWPKKSSKVATDITEDTIRDVALAMGMVDIKVCAVDAVWSGLKLVIRRENRKLRG